MPFIVAYGINLNTGAAVNLKYMFSHIILNRRLGDLHNKGQLRVIHLLSLLKPTSLSRPSTKPCGWMLSHQFQGFSKRLYPLNQQLMSPNLSGRFSSHLIFEKAAGTDELQPGIRLTSAPFIAESPKELFNLSVWKTQALKNWQAFLICLMFKKCNYCHVNLMSVI